MNIKLVMAVFLLSLHSMTLFAGDAAGHGGSTLARILAFAQSEIIKTFPLLVPQSIDFGSEKLNHWYANNHEKMTGELESLRIVPTSLPIHDSGFGYESWIRVSRTGDFVVEYNPDLENYLRLVGIINSEYRRSGIVQTTPSNSDVTEYLLHEIGHRYGLDEPDAWTFAQKVGAKFKFHRPLKTRLCSIVRMGFPKTAATIIVLSSTEFRKVALDDFTIYSRLDPQTFSFICTVVDEVEKTEVFSLRVSADSEIATASYVKGAWGITCE